MLLCNEYTPAQWQWIWERYCESYSIKELSMFLYVHRETVRRRFQRMGRRPYNREDLLPLCERRGEFSALAKEGRRCA